MGNRMTDCIVFFLHGMGVHKKGWSKPAVKVLSNRAKALSPSEGWKIIPKELEYDSKLQNLLDSWSKKSKDILSAAQPANKSALSEIVGWLNDAGDQGNFAWAAAADVFLWRTSSTIRKLLVNHLANQVAPVIAEASPAQARNIHFVAHSLGTAVCHEMLSALAYGAWTPESTEARDGFEVSRWRPMGIHMVANVSKLLELQRNPVYRSPIRPGHSGDPKSYCQFYRNYNHRLDPIGQIKPFEPPWADSGRYDSFEPTRLKSEKEIHTLAHYINLPIVHVSMLETMFGRLPPDSDAFDQMPSGFKAPQKIVQDRLKAEIEEFGSNSSLFQTVRSVYRFFMSR